jgi:hypothetical protein
LTALLVTALVAFSARPAQARINAPYSLGRVCYLCTNIIVLKVEKLDKDKNLIYFRKVRDLKGEHKGEVIRHAIGKNGYHEREWQYVMEWAAPGKTAVLFHNGRTAETCIGNYWYQAALLADWWHMSHGEPFLLRTFSGDADKLVDALKEIVAGKEVVVSCLADGSKKEMELRRGKLQRLKASLKLQDYDPKRDFVDWVATKSPPPREPDDRKLVEK